MNLEGIQQIAAKCKLCDLHTGREKAVFAKGNPKAPLMICGMVPGPEENKVGLPFVGSSGQLLDKILASVDITLDSVYITNLVKCWLKPGLDLQPEWIAACMQFIVAEISIIKPKVIVTLGLPASKTLLNLPNDVRMGKIRGSVSLYSHMPKIEIIPTYHPSFILRGGGEKHDKYPRVIEDFELAQYIVMQNNQVG